MKTRVIILIAFFGFTFCAGYICGTATTHHIARIWHGATTEAKKDSYFEYLRDNGIAKIAATKGNLGAYVLRRVQDGKADFLVISLWDSFDSMKTFAGPNVDKAVVLGRDKEFLIEVEPTVNNYEILLDQLK